MNRANYLGFVSCGALGSSLMHTAVFRELRRAFPDSNIGIASDRRGVELFRHNPYGIKVFDVMGPAAQLDRDFFETLVRIKQEDYNTALVFSLSEPYYMRVSQYLGGFEHRIGQNGGDTVILNNYYDRFLNTPGYEQKFLEKFGFTDAAAAASDSYFGRYNLSFLEPLGVKAEELSCRPEIWSSADDREAVESHFRELGVQEEDLLAGVNIGGRQGNNLWNTDNYSELIKGMFSESGGLVRGRALKVMINYAAHEMYTFTDIIRSLPRTLPVYGVPQNMSTGQLAEAVGRCNFFISTDTGAAHVAQARKVPSLVLYPDEPMRKRWMCPDAQVLPLTGKGHVNDIAVNKALLASLNAILQWAVLGSNQRAPACEAGILPLN